MNAPSSPDDTGSQPARAPERDATWIMVGAVSSGKTFFVDLVTVNPGIEREIRWAKESPYANFNFHPVSPGTPGSESYAVRALKSLAQNGRPPATSGKPREHVFHVSAQLKDGRSSTPEVPDPLLTRCRVRLVDSPGANQMPNDDPSTLTPEDQEERAKLSATAQDNAEALLLFLPARTRKFQSQEVEHLNLTEMLRRVCKKEFRKLKRIAVLLTKYDAAFQQHGDKAEQFARDPSQIPAVWELIDASGHLMEGISDAATADQELSVVFFPVSSYGFIGDTGFANVLTLPDDYDNATEDLPIILRHRSSLEVGPYDVPLFPDAFSQADYDNYWKPFNLLAPLVFLAGGNPAGLLHMTLNDLAGRLQKADGP